MPHHQHRCDLRVCTQTSWPQIMESHGGHVREACPSLAGRVAPTPIGKARHSPQTPPRPTQKPLASRRVHRGLRCYTYTLSTGPVPHHPIPRSHRRNGDAHRPLLRAGRRRGLRAAPQGLRRSHSDPDRIPHSLHAPTTDALRVSDRSQVGAPTRS
jgi:hypothetical protein